MGGTFNTVDPDAPTDGPKISAVAIVMTTLAFVLVVLRVYVRQRMVKAFGAGKPRSSISPIFQLGVDEKIRRLGHCLRLGEYSLCSKCSPDKMLTRLRLHQQASPSCLASVRIPEPMPFSISNAMYLD